MAGRRAVVKTLDWVAFAERVPPNQKAMFNQLKARSDAIAAKLASLPAKPAAIDWSHYKAVLGNVAMVEEFEKKRAVVADFVAQSNVRIAEHQESLDKLTNMIPYDQMSVADLEEVFPETKLDKEKYPYWPHKHPSELC
ncbi:hypothetical protein DNTS_025740 [Danionella cerebrum]|uniref:Uncharacterized protein n=1 Tax=Danionella cerebrum TaxID=2873325 RepID=A0A553QQH6_9TELE|nr:hypothetical protein DNTS_025740 [Danionella translucida]